MLDLKFIRDHPDDVRHAIGVKQIDLDLDDLLAADRAVSDLQQKIQALREERKANAARTPKATPEERPTLIARGRSISDALKELEPALREAEEVRHGLLLRVPQIPSPEAP